MEHPLAILAPGTRLGSCQLIRELARGGMGVVYEAAQLGLERRVAVKVLPALPGAEDLERFRVEAEAAARLQHPNVVRVHDFGVAEGRPFIVLDLVEGESLDRLVGREGPLPPQRTAALLEPIARALQHAHEAGVLHRDVKPANILLERGQRPLLTDFGLARNAAEPGRLTLTGEVLGTPSYMPPEQAQGLRRQVDARSDVYGLGATLFELLTGRPPFEGQSPVQIMERVCREPPPRPSQLRPLPAELERVCLRCLAKRPRDRYPSAAALAADLARFQRGEQVSRPPLRWQRPLLASAALLLAATLGGLLAAWQMAPGTPPANAPAPPPGASAAPEPDPLTRELSDALRQSWGRRGPAERLAASLEQTLAQAETDPGAAARARVPLRRLELERALAERLARAPGPLTEAELTALAALPGDVGAAYARLPRALQASPPALPLELERIEQHDPAVGELAQRQSGARAQALLARGDAGAAVDLLLALSLRRPLPDALLPLARGAACALGHAEGEVPPDAGPQFGFVWDPRVADLAERLLQARPGQPLPRALLAWLSSQARSQLYGLQRDPARLKQCYRLFRLATRGGYPRPMGDTDLDFFREADLLEAGSQDPRDWAAVYWRYAFPLDRVLELRQPPEGRPAPEFLAQADAELEQLLQGELPPWVRPYVVELQLAVRWERDPVGHEERVHRRIEQERGHLPLGRLYRHLGLYLLALAADRGGEERSQLRGRAREALEQALSATLEADRAGLVFDVADEVGRIMRERVRLELSVHDGAEALAQVERWAGLGLRTGPECQRERGAALLELGRLDEARAELEAYDRVRPRDGRGHSLLRQVREREAAQGH